MKFKSTSPIFALMLLCSMFLSSPIFAASAQIANDEKIAPAIDLTSSAGYQRASALEREATNLTELAKQGTFQQVSASEAKEAKQIAKILAQTGKNPILIADQSSLAFETVKTLALEINGKLEINLKNKNIWQLDFRALVETSKNTKEARARIKAVLSDAEKSRGQAVLFVEDFARLLASPEIGSLVGDAISQGKLRIIGAMRAADAKDAVFTDKKCTAQFTRRATIRR